MLEIRDMSKCFRNKQVYKDVDLSFGKGITVLLAPNGAGKTTLMNMITTLTKPTKGRIFFNKKNIYKMGDEYRRIIGYLPQKTGYYKNYSAFDNLMYIAALKGLPKKHAVNIINMYLEKFGLADVKHKKLKEFSGGMIQRVGIIGALLNDPEILVLDEPTAGLDPKERVRLKNTLSDLGKDRIIIISTHITSDVEFIANRIVMIKDKKILHHDSVEGICEKYQGKIFEVLLDIKDVDLFERTHFVLMQQYEGDKVKLRFYSDDNGNPNYREVTPNLEDVFMCEYRESSMEAM